MCKFFFQFSSGLIRSSTFLVDDQKKASNQMGDRISETFRSGTLRNQAPGES